MLRRTARRDRFIGLFVLGAILFNPPILNLFGGTVFGWPALFVYLFGAWALLIAAVALLSRTGRAADDESASR